MENDPVSAMQFNAVLRDELAALRPDLTPPPDATIDQLYATIDRASEPTAALCLSGGGIRSASFALGILQSLARFGVLGQFHYLSTVSGGGYIGSWLTAWRHHAKCDEQVFRQLDRTADQSGKEADEIYGLRADSNYLTPKLGVLSADTWAAAALTIRNLVLNWLVFLPFFMGLLYCPWLYDDLLKSIAMRPRLAMPLMGLGFVAVTIGLAVASYGRRRASHGWLTDGRFVRMVLGPVIFASMCFTGGLAALDQSIPSLSEGAIAGAVCYALAWLLASVFRSRDPRPTTSRAALEAGHAKDLTSWMVAGAISGCLLVGGMQYSVAYEGPFKTEWLTVLGGAWTMLSIFGGELIYVGLRSYAKRGDMDREWLGRAAGWLTAGAASWTLVSAVALFSLLAKDMVSSSLVESVSYAGSVAGGISGVIALVFGGSGKTKATGPSQVRGGLSLTQITSIAGIIFAVFLAVCLSLLDGWLSTIVTDSFPTLAPWLVDAGGVVLLTGLSAVISWFINVNRFSLHALYRNRLVRAFLGSARATADQAREPDPFTGFDQTDNLRMATLPTNRLLHVINIALNTVSTKNLAWQERRAEPFTVTPLATGNPNVGYRPTSTYGSKEGGISLGTAMAISGAAVSPNMGYHSSPLLGFLLMLFNIRLGWWLGNPARDTFDREGPDFSIVPLLEELAGQTTNEGRWVYLSDGGHFENLGVYEMVRRRCRAILVIDAGGDPECAFEELGNAVRRIYIDQGVNIDFEILDIAARQVPPKAGSYCALGRVTYPGSSTPGWLLYVKPGYHGDEPAHIRSYAIAHNTFPHESTANQWFSESQFESYRGLGAHIAELICSGGQAIPAMQHPQSIDLQTFRNQAEKYLNKSRGVPFECMVEEGPGSPLLAASSNAA
jgi:Patatin-like phospholipase